MPNILGEVLHKELLGTQQGKPSNGSYFGQVVLITVSKVFRANIEGRLARKLILDLKARAENYLWAKTIGKKIQQGKEGLIICEQPQ